MIGYSSQRARINRKRIRLQIRLYSIRVSCHMQHSPFSHWEQCCTSSTENGHMSKPCVSDERENRN